VRQMLQDSERRQQSELALRMAEAVRELQQQRQADLVKIDRALGVMQSRTGFEVMRTQRQMNSLAQQVSQRP
jgi:CheY-like chemotaxis protein